MRSMTTAQGFLGDRDDGGGRLARIRRAKLCPQDRRRRWGWWRRQASGRWWSGGRFGSGPLSLRDIDSGALSDIR
jgi:hypothetical protein